MCKLLAEWISKFYFASEYKILIDIFWKKIVITGDVIEAWLPHGSKKSGLAVPRHQNGKIETASSPFSDINQRIR